MLCKRATILPIECIARGYLTGSGWKDYQGTGAVCGHVLSRGLRNGDRLEQPIFTPSTKAASGHDENITIAEGTKLIGAEQMAFPTALGAFSTLVAIVFHDATLACFPGFAQTMLSRVSDRQLARAILSLLTCHSGIAFTAPRSADSLRTAAPLSGWERA